MHKKSLFKHRPKFFSFAHHHHGQLGAVRLRAQASLMSLLALLSLVALVAVDGLQAQHRSAETGLADAGLAQVVV